MLKRFLSCAAAFCLAASLVPATALAIPAESLQNNEERVASFAETRETHPLDATLTMPINELQESQFGTGYDNNPFQVMATVKSTGDVSNVVAAISIDDPAIVLDESLSSSIPLGTFAADSTKTAAWTLRAIPQAQEKSVTVKVIVTGYGLNTLTVSQQVKLGAVSDGKRTRTVTFDANGGQLTDSESMSVPVGSLVSEPTAPTRTNHRFDGWYANPKCEGLPWFNALNSYQGEAITGNITLYAKWIANRFDRSLDSLNFANASTYFFNSGDAENYRVTGDYEALIYDQLSDYPTIWEDMKKKMDEEWGGSCFGMSALVALMCSGDISPDFVQAKAKSAIDLKSPKESSVVKNTVNYYYLQQMLGKAAEVRGSYKEDEALNRQKLVETLKDDTAYPVVLGIDLYKDDRKQGGHAVVAYGITDIDGGYDIDIWDPNDPEGKTINSLFVSEGYDESYFNGEYDEAGSTNAYYDRSFLKYTLRVEDGYDTNINVQKRLAQRGAQGIAITSRTVQLASTVEASTYTSQWQLGMIDIETNALSINVDSNFNWQANDGALPEPTRMCFTVRDDGSVHAAEFDELGYIPQVEFVNEANQPSRIRFRVPACGSNSMRLNANMGYGTSGIDPERSDFKADVVELALSSSDDASESYVFVTSPVGPTDGTSFTLDGWGLQDPTREESVSVMTQTPLGQPVTSSMTYSHVRKAVWEGEDLVPVTHKPTIRSLTASGITSVAISVRDEMHGYGASQNAISSYRVSTGWALDGASTTSLSVSDGLSTDSIEMDDLRPYIVSDAAGGRVQVEQGYRESIDDAYQYRHFATLSFGKTISFYSMGGSPIERRNDIGEGSTVRDLESPQREGFLFDGWYTSPTCDPALSWDPNSDKVTENVTLYAKWRRDTGYSHRVTFTSKADGFQDVVFLVNDGASLEDAVLPNPPEGEEWDWANFSSIKRDITVRPKSENKDGAMQKAPEPYSATIKNEDSNGTLAVDASSSATGLYAGNTVRVKATPNSGYRVDGVTALDKNGNAVPVSDQGNGVYSFAMPAGNVTVSATFVEASARIIVHNVSAPAVNGGSFEVAVNGSPATKAECGNLVTVTVSPSDNYRFDASTFSVKKSGTDTDVVVDKKNADGTLYTFVMPDYSVTIGGTFSPVSASERTYKITLPVNTNGTFTAVSTSVRAGDPVTITAVPNAGYEVDEESLSVMAGETAIDYEFTRTAGTDGGTITFQMPANDVTVEGVFVEKSYTITCAATTHGTIVASPRHATEGTQVKLTMKPEEEYKLAEETLKVLMPNGSTVPWTKQEDGAYAFTMPASNVTVSAAFMQKTYGVTMEVEPEFDDSGCGLSTQALVNGEWFVLGPNGSVPKGTDMLIKPVLAEGWELATLSYGYQEPGYTETTVHLRRATDTDAALTQYAFNMPGANVTVRASFVQTRDESEPYLKFVTADSTDLKSKVLTLGDDLTMTLEAVVPPGPEEEWDKTVDPPTVTVGEEVASWTWDTANPDALVLKIEPLKAGETTIKVAVDGIFEGGQTAQCHLVVAPYETAPSSASANSEVNATVSISNDAVVAKRLKTGGLRFRIKDEMTNVADLRDIVAKNKKASDELIHLVDLSFEQLEDGEWKPADSGLQGITRTVTFNISDAMQQHLTDNHGLFIAYLDPTTKTLTRLDAFRDSATGNKLSFTTDHFSAYAIMAKDILVPHAITIEPCEGGVLTPSHTTAVAGTIVTFTATPNEGYKAKGLSCMEGSDPASVFSVVVKGNALEGTLTMPDADVRAKADFVKEGTQAEVKPETPAPSESKDDPKEKPKDTSKDPDPAGGPLYANGGGTDGGAVGGSDDTRTTSTANLNGTSRATTYTAGSSASGGSTSLVKTGDDFPVAVVCTGIMFIVVAAALLYLRRRRRQ